MRRGMVAGAVGLGCVGLMVLIQGTPATANRLTAGQMAGGDIARDCEQATRGTPPGGPGNVKLDTDVPEGAIVEPGQEIGVILTWDPGAWSGEQLDMALACVLVKGGLDPDMSEREGPTANDGVFEYRLTVPENIKPDCDICVEGFVAGMTADGGPQIVASDRRCFMSGPPGPPTPPATTPPATTPPATTPPATTPLVPEPPDATPPAPATTPEPAPPAEDPPAQVAGITTARPAPAPAPAAAAPAGELPRTGPATAIQLVSAGGGLTLTFGGLAVMGGAGRRLRRRRGAA